MTTTQALSAGKFSLCLGPFPVTANHPLRSTWTPSELISLISQDRASCRMCPSSLIFDLQPPFGVSGFSTPWQLAWIPLPWTPWMLDPESPWGPCTAFSFKLLILGMCACSKGPAFPAQAETLIYCPEARVHTHTLPIGDSLWGLPLSRAPFCTREARQRQGVWHSQNISRCLAERSNERSSSAQHKRGLREQPGGLAQR